MSNQKNIGGYPLEISFAQTEYLAENEQNNLQIIKDVLTYAYNKVINHKNNNDELGIIFTDDLGIQEINRIYRNKDVPTDVISFALTDVDDNIIYDEEIPRALGDIYISIERTREQAQNYNHSFRRELVFLILHGFLHLCGYDHLTKAEEEVMFSLQNEILATFQINRTTTL